MLRASSAEAGIEIPLTALAGCDGYIVKPIRYREFLAAISAHLSRLTAVGAAD